MKALVICHDYWHSGDIVEKGLSFLQRNHEWEFTVLKEMENIDLQTVNFSDYQGIFVCKDNRNSPEDEGQWLDDLIAKKFVSYVNEGGCLMVLHAGCVACKSSPIFKDLVGCEFIAHPDQCAVDYLPVTNETITEGVSAFTVHDEHYEIAIHATDIHLFLNGQSVHFTQPAGYWREVGHGKVIVMTPGHNLPVWENKTYQKLIVNALDFGRKGD